MKRDEFIKSSTIGLVTTFMIPTTFFRDYYPKPNAERSIKDVFSPPKTENVNLKGKIGNEIDKVIHARILSNKAQTEILPEALNAFRNRVDDRLIVNRGLWQGEFWGKWILSAVATQRYTANKELKKLIEKSVDNLLNTQDSNGYIGTYYDSDFVKGNSWNVWCRKYTLWGLVSSYELLGKPKILKSASRLMDHLMTQVGPSQTDIVHTGNFYGLPSSSILTPLMGLYRHTQNDRYLNYAQYIINQWSKDHNSPPDIIQKGLTGTPPYTWFPQSGNWTKAYEFISCLEGLLDFYKVDGSRKYLEVVENVYASICQTDRVITGGIGDYKDRLTGTAYRTDVLSEPGATVYWERLSYKLLKITGNPKYADEIERLMYNVLLATMNRDGSWGVRRLGLSQPHLIAPLQCYLDYHQCCVDNLPRGLLQLTKAAIMKGDKDGSVVINFYIAGKTSIILPTGICINFTIQTDYPESGEINIKVEPNKSIHFPLKIRIPPWSKKTLVEVNGNAVRSIEPGKYLTITKQWRVGDHVHIQFDMRTKIIPFKGSNDAIAFKRGPVILARSTLIGNNIDYPVVPKTLKSGFADITKLNSNHGIWMMFEAQTVGGNRIRLCDYASTGKDYQKPSNPYAIKDMLHKHTKNDLRVWLPVPHDIIELNI